MFFLCEVVYGRGGLSGICRGSITCGGLGMKFQPDVSLVSNIFEGSFTEEVTGSGKSVFEVGFNFEASEARKKFYSTASAYRVVIEKK